MTRLTRRLSVIDFALKCTRSVRIVYNKALSKRLRSEVLCSSIAFVLQGHSKPPSDTEVEKEGEKEGLKDDDFGSANINEKNEAADDPDSDTAQKFKNVSNTERDAASTA